MTSLGSTQKSVMESTQNLIPGKTGTNQQQHHLPLSQTPELQQTSYKKEIYALAVVQIIVGITILVFGNILRGAYVGQTSMTYTTKLPTWAGVLIIITGAFSLSAQRNAPRGQLVGTLILSIIVCIEAAAGVVIFSFDLASHTYDTCYYEDTSAGVAYNQCKMYRGAYLVLENAILSFLLVLALLEFCISISTSVFLIHWLCDRSSQTAAPGGTEMPPGVPVGHGVPMTYGQEPPPHYQANPSAEGKWPGYGTH